MVGQGEGNYNVQVTFHSLYILYIEHVGGMHVACQGEGNYNVYIYIYIHITFSIL